MKDFLCCCSERAAGLFCTFWVPLFWVFLYPKNERRLKSNCERQKKDSLYSMKDSNRSISMPKHLELKDSKAKNERLFHRRSKKLMTERHWLVSTPIFWVLPSIFIPLTKFRKIFGLHLFTLERTFGL